MIVKEEICINNM